ncbi:coiled-coil domain-containing protein 171-like isoform X2 [Mercenaria mercenaria]|uniref:coiled-coil domain-containing protein 171-like isoform X2 n=1 Tax=Mercenaria mercenaria TaxID=6596 RepID=UPI00234F1A77|nr:coiled-coil domain-containing protein 171-like isoform X2 [Mercenaria mercenaria]
MNSDDESRQRDVGFADRDESQQSEDILRFQDGSYQFSYGKGGKPDMSFSLDHSQDWKMAAMSPGPEDSGRLRIENNQLKLQLKQITADLQTEQDTVSNLRKRLNTVERDRLEAATKANKEVSELESQIAKLRASLEKGEASRANMEFELARTKRDLAQQKHTAAGRETSLEETSQQLKQKLTEYGDEIKRLEEGLQQSRDSLEERERQLKREIELKDLELSKNSAEHEVLQSEKDKLGSLVQQQENAISDLNEKLQDLESEKKHHGDNLRRTGTELEYCKEREDRAKKDLETALQRLRATEESIESERAAHLETKFNSEIVQLRVRDLEGAFDVEKSANNEANKAIDRLTKQIKELETSYEDERRTNKQLTERLGKLEKEHSSVKKQLTNEVENKKSTIGSLSKELEVHQKNFLELKEELSKARKRQIYLEETYGGSMRELELLLQNFQISGESKQKKNTQQKGKESKGSKTPAPSVVLENLRLTLSDYRKRLDNTSEELTKMKKSSTALNKEIEQCKEMIWAKDKALEDAQKSYTRTAKELNRVRSEYGELETLLTRLKVDMQSTATNQSKDRTRIQELSEEIMKLVKKHKNDEEEKLAFLHGLYQRLLSGKIVVPTKEKTFNQFSWHDLTNMVYDQVATLLNNLQNAEEKISHLEDALRSREEGWKEEHISREDQLNKLSTLTKEREMSWHKQKQEMEEHYQQLLNEMQARIKKSQSVADQAWEKIRVTGGVQQGLESECAELQGRLADMKKENSSLLASCSLLIGAFYPLCSRSNFLAMQRRIMEDQLNNWDVCRERVELLVHTLTSEMNKTNGKQKETAPTKRNPILVFRTGAIAVLAANRLKRLGRSCVRTFVTHDSATGQNNILVCTGSTDVPVRDDEEERYRDRQGPGETGLLHWLTSSELLHTLTSSTSELMETINQVKGRDKVGTVETRAIVNAARNSFTRLFDRLGRYYENVSIRPDVGFRERNSLVRLLGRGLSKVIRTASGDEIAPSSPQELMISLQTHILEFTQRLHTVEVERRSLLQEVSRLQEEVERLGPEKEELVTEGNDIAVTQQGNKYVPIEKFESVCNELNNALRREEQAQNLLQEQARQLEELSARMDIFSSEGMEKEQTLSEAIQGLAETKLELRRKEQTVRQVNKQLAALEGEKESLRNNLQDAEKALRTVAKDKDILTSYIQAVENALVRTKHEVGLKSGKDVSLSKLLLNADFIPKDVGKAGPELIACQNLVGAFVDTQHHLVSKMRSLEEEMENNRRHVTLLKQELNDAVRREHEQFEFSRPTKDRVFSGDRIIEEEFNENDFTQREFMPLREDSELSFNSTKNRSRVSASPKKGDSYNVHFR